jgi:sugar phosphate isomerase/epimerase
VEKLVKVGLGSYAYPWSIQRGMTAPELLEQAILHRAEVLQICDNLDHAVIDWADLAAKAKDNQIQLQLGSFGGPSEAIAAARIAEFIGSPILRFVIGHAFVAQSVHEVADDFRDAARACMDHGVRLAIENHDFFNAPQFAQIVELIGHGCGITLDTANSLANLEGTESIVRHLGAHALCLHAKDVVVEREFHMFGFRIFGVQAGRGAVDFRFLQANLPNLETVVLEQWPPPVNNQPPIEHEREMVGPGLAYLKSVWTGQ